MSFGQFLPGVQRPPLYPQDAQTSTQQQSTTLSSTVEPTTRLSDECARQAVGQQSPSASEPIQPVPLLVRIPSTRTLPTHPHPLPEERTQTTTGITTKVGGRTASVRSAGPGRRGWGRRGWAGRVRLPTVLEYASRQAEARGSRTDRWSRLLRIPVSLTDLPLSDRCPMRRRQHELTGPSSRPSPRQSRTRTRDRSSPVHGPLTPI